QNEEKGPLSQSALPLTKAPHSRTHLPATVSAAVTQSISERRPRGHCPLQMFPRATQELQPERRKSPKPLYSVKPGCKAAACRGPYLHLNGAGAQAQVGEGVPTV
ncbi:hypothetical protein NQZ68_007122, partial [Dissostichus eleginoides]